jgi:RNA polymerase sigma-70 factor (ECF subfamily)
MKRDLFWTYLEAEHAKAEAFCRKLAGNREDGDDLYQDALLTALRKVRTLRNPDAFRPWLYRIVVNPYRNRVQGPWWRRRVPLTPELRDAQACADPTDAYAARRWLKRGFAALTPEDRALVVLFEIEGWTIAELARLKRRPTGTIKARLSRARKKMRKAIEDHLPDESTKRVNNESGAAYALPHRETSRD